MVARSKRSDVVRAAEMPEEERRKIRKMSITEIADKTFKEVWGEDLNEVLRRSEKKEIVRRD